jgi:2,3-bisphosphoglycerate-dependent phosphoglycerate mutase
MAGMSRLLLIRHCESSGQAPNAALTPRGMEQANELARWLQLSHLIDHVISSPYLRALQTIEPFAAVAGLSVEQDARLAERRNVYIESVEEAGIDATRLCGPRLSGR